MTSPVCKVPLSTLWDVRDKLRLILIVADGPNQPVIDKAVKDIDRLLPEPQFKGPFLISG